MKRGVARSIQSSVWETDKAADPLAISAEDSMRPVLTQSIRKPEVRVFRQLVTLYSYEPGKHAAELLI